MCLNNRTQFAPLKGDQLAPSAATVTDLWIVHLILEVIKRPWTLGKTRQRPTLSHHKNTLVFITRLLLN